MPDEPLTIDMLSLDQLAEIVRDFVVHQNIQVVYAQEFTIPAQINYGPMIVDHNQPVNITYLGIGEP